MIGTFALVTALSFKNGVLQRVRRLRQPRYLVSALAGLAYMWMMFFRRALKRMPLSWNLNELFLTGGATILVVLAILIWALPDDSGGIQFTPAEIQFLFPAPLGRWQLLLYKLIRSQAQILTSATIFYIFGVRKGYIVGTWAAMTAIHLYLIAAAFGRARLKQAGIGVYWRLVAVLLLLAGFWTLLRHYYTDGWMEHVAKAFGSHDKQLAAQFLAPMHTPILAAVYFIPRLFVQAAFPATPLLLVEAIAGLLVVGTVLFLFASRVQVSFEEASIVKSQKAADRADRQKSQRSGQTILFRRAKPLFKLKPTGPPEVAIFWKNLTASMRMSVPILLGVIALMFLFGVISHVSKTAEINQFFGLILLCFAGGFTFLGPFSLRNDLRFDLPKLEILKTYPLPGERLVAAEVAAPLAMCVVIDLLLLLGGNILLQSGAMPKGKLLYFVSPEFIVIALMFIVPVTAIQLLIQNAAVIFFPAWSVVSKEEMRGFAASGQRMVMLFGHLLTFAVAIVPAAVIFVPSVLLAQKIAPDSSAALAISTVPAFALMVGEIALALRFLGDQFDRLDLSRDLDTLGSETS